MPGKLRLGRRRSKYRNIKTVVDGRKFDSRKEAAHYELLKARQFKGEISCLKCQVSFTIKIKKSVICRYIADFTYHENGKRVVVDVKGVRTDVYKLKRKLMLACLGITIVEV